MSRQIKIKVNGNFLNFQKSDFNVSEENNSFSDSFKIPHNSYPIRIIEDEKSINALGDPSTSNTFKKITYEAVIFVGSSRFSGILEITSILPGFRKANVKFGSAIIKLMSKKIADFYQPINLLGLNPEENPFVEESETQYSGGWSVWNDWQEENKLKVFPEVDFQLPKIKWDKKFGETKKGDTWHHFENYLNNRDYYGVFYENLLKNDETQEIDYWAENKNIVAPQVFLLSPLYKFAESVGYKVKGKFVDHPFVRRLLFANFNNQMYRYKFFIYPQHVNALSGASWQIPDISDTMNGIYFPYKRVVLSNPGLGDWKLHYKFDMNHNVSSASYHKLIMGFDGQEYDLFEATTSPTVPLEIQEGEISFTVEEGSSSLLSFLFMSNDQYFPQEYELYFARDIGDVELYKTHPTLDFSRYLPKWSVSSYINNLKNFFNLKTDIDDITKTLSFNFNEEDYLINGKTFNLLQDVQIKEADNPSHDSFLFKFDNEEDNQLYLSNDEMIANKPKGEYTQEISNKFKYIPIGTSTAEFSEEVEDKGGTGLMIYSGEEKATIARSFSGINLKLEGPGGIVDSFWRVWVRMRLNAHSISVKAPLTNTEILIISKLQKINTSGQLFLVKKTKYKESEKGFLEAKLELESVNL